MIPPPVIITNRNSVLLPKEQTSYPIEARDLEHLENMISRMDRRDVDYLNVCMGMLGIAAGAGTALISLSYAQGVSTRNWVISWVIFAASFAVAAFAYFASRRELERLRADKDDVLEYLRRIKERFHAPEAEATAQAQAAQ